MTDTFTPTPQDKTIYRDGNIAVIHTPGRGFTRLEYDDNGNVKSFAVADFIEDSVTISDNGKMVKVPVYIENSPRLRLAMARVHYAMVMGTTEGT